MKILKFGGSSVESNTQMLNVFDIVKNTYGKKVVILSACKGITDKLEQVAILSANKNTIIFNEEKDNIITSIEEHHIGILNSTLQKYLSVALDLVKKILSDLQNILAGVSYLNELTNSTKDLVLSFGELLSTTIFHFICKENGLDNTLLDARDLIYTDDNFNEASPIISLCKDNIIREFKKIKTDLVITQGFIGSYNETQRKTTTLGRGGSDYSAAIIGSILNAEEIQIWTDVNGILSADPRYYSDTFTIKEMSFSEVSDLSFWGAKVLHPKTIQPAIEKDISIKILNTFNPTNTGTIITSNCLKNNSMINSVIAKENCLLYFGDKTNINPSNILYSGFSNKTSVYLLDNKDIVNLDNSFPCDVICICGSNLENSSILFTKFFPKLNFLEDINILQIIFGFSFNSILLVLKKCDDIHKITSQIHDIIRKLYYSS